MNKKKHKRFAVALNYEKKTNAPKVIAKGEGLIADNIINKGKETGVELYEDKSLATELMNLNIGDEIPEELYTTVASILAYIYNLDNNVGD